MTLAVLVLVGSRDHAIVVDSEGRGVDRSVRVERCKLAAWRASEPGEKTVGRSVGTRDYTFRIDAGDKSTA